MESPVDSDERVKNEIEENAIMVEVEGDKIDHRTCLSWEFHTHNITLGTRKKKIVNNSFVAMMMIINFFFYFML